MKRDFQKKFVEKEVRMIQEKFNQTFGEQLVCDLRTRQAALLSICWLGILGKRLIETNDRDKTRNFVQQFVRAKNVLNNFFTRYDNQMKERRNDVDASACSGGKNHGWEQSGNMSKL